MVAVACFLPHFGGQPPFEVSANLFRINYSVATFSFEQPYEAKTSFTDSKTGKAAEKSLLV